MEPDFRAGGRRSAEQCSDTNYFVARDCSGATRSAESRRMNTTEINATWTNNRLLLSIQKLLIEQHESINYEPIGAAIAAGCQHKG
jgi:hypothetical protein